MQGLTTPCTGQCSSLSCNVFTVHCALFCTVYCITVHCSQVQCWHVLSMVTSAMAALCARVWNKAGFNSLYALMVSSHFPSSLFLFLLRGWLLVRIADHDNKLLHTALRLRPLLIRTVMHCIYCTAFHCSAPHCTALYYTTLYCTALYCIALYCIALHCTVLQCI